MRFKQFTTATLYLAFLGGSLSSCNLNVDPPTMPIPTPAPVQPISEITFLRMDTLGQARSDLVAASTTDKVLFAGGNAYDRFPPFYRNVDIYDATQDKWSRAELSEARSLLVGIGLNHLAMFAGGYTRFSYAGSSVVDIYDVTKDIWGTAQLSVGRALLAAAATGTKIAFAGGMSDDGTKIQAVVDIYDTATGQWSTAQLSQPRYNLSAAAAGTKILFYGGSTANGGYSNRVDIYDTITGQWTTHDANSPRTHAVGVSADNKVLFAGGWNDKEYPETVDIYDVETNQWTTMQKPIQWDWIAATAIGSKVLFASPGYPIQIYNTKTREWSSIALRRGRYGSAAGATKGKALFAGGYNTDVFPTVTSKAVDIFVGK